MIKWNRKIKVTENTFHCVAGSLTHVLCCIPRLIVSQIRKERLDHHLLLQPLDGA